MKRYIYILALAVASVCYAQQDEPQNVEAACVRLWFYPYFYCECQTAATPFQYPLEVQVTDTMWFKASLNDIRRGLSAYWFADCSITFEVYAFCASEAPTLSMTVGRNQMKEMSVEEINDRLSQAGNTGGLEQLLTPRVRVYPNGGSGTVYCYPYDQGPVSTCESILPVVAGMTYVCDQAEEVYELEPSRIASNGQCFIHWKQKKNFPGTIRLTADSCNGAEIASATLTDSLHVLVPDASVMTSLKLQNRNVYVHVTHDSSYVGRMIYHNRIVWSEQAIDVSVCQGKGFELQDTVLYETTVYPNDTLWAGRDTLSLTTYHLTVTEPTPQNDTLLLKDAQLPYSYRNNIIPKNGWGDYDFTVHTADRCDERYLLHVEHKINRQETVQHDTLCMGKTVTYGGVTYAADTTIQDSVWADADTWVVRDITIHFTEPEVEYDTIEVEPSKMTARGYWYGALGAMVQYGDTMIVVKRNNACTRWVQLHVEEGEEDPTVKLDILETEERPVKYMRDGVIYIRREGIEYDLLGRPINRK